MTELVFDEDGVDVTYDGIDFRLERALIEEAIGKPYPEVTDHEILKIIEKDPTFEGEPRQVKHILTVDD